MKYSLLVISLLLLCGFTTQEGTVQSGQETIVFMRHGEKPILENGQLTCQGLNRSLALPNVLLAKFGKPNYIFAPHPYYGNTFYYVRGLMNIEPTAIQLGLSVNTQYYYHEVLDVSRMLLSERYRNAVVFVSWEHLNIFFITKKIMTMLDADSMQVPAWPENDYDSLYVIHINWDVNPPKVEFVHDRENLDHQSKNCPSIPNLTANGRDVGTFIFVPSAEANVEAETALNQLSCKGLNRSLALANRLTTFYPQINNFILAAPKNKVEQNYLQSLATIEPTLVKHCDTNILVGHENIESVVSYLKTASFFNQTIVIGWPKDELANLVRSVYKDNGGDPLDVPNPVADHDSIYEIKLKRDLDGLKAQFRIVKQNLDHVSTICPNS